MSGDQIVDNIRGKKPAGTEGQPDNSHLTDNKPPVKPAADAAKPATDAAKPASDAAKPATDAAAKPTDAAKPRDPEVAKALSVSKEVTRILDNDVPRANQAHKLDEAGAAYDKAIALAKQVTPEQIAKAKAEYAEVIKAKQTEKDPDKLRALTEKQADLYTLTRVQDCAMGNKALWLFRQGKVDEGSSMFLQAAGLDKDSANRLAKMSAADAPEIKQKLDLNSPILRDVNFMNQFQRVKESGQKLPEAIEVIHQQLRDRPADQTKPAADQAKGPTDQARPDARPGADAKAGPTMEALAAKATALEKSFDPAANDAAAAKFQTTATELMKSTDHKISADQRAALDAGVAAADQRFDLVKAQSDFLHAKLDTVLTPEKKAALDKAEEQMAKGLNTLAANNKDASGKPIVDQAGHPVLPQAIQGLLNTVGTASISAADRQAAAAKLSQANPDIAAAFKQINDTVGQDGKGADAFTLYLMTQANDRSYQNAAADKVATHFTEANLLNASGDKAAAKSVLETGFTGLNQDAAAALSQMKPVQDLTKILGAKIESDSQPAAAGDQTQKPGDQVKPVTDSTASGVDPTTGKDIDQLLKDAAASAKEAPNKIAETKASYEAALKLAEDPKHLADLKATMEMGVKALETGKLPNGQDLDDATRIKIHQDNQKIATELALPALIATDYSAYLGGKSVLKADMQNPIRAAADGQLDLNKSMDAAIQRAIKDADGMPTDLMKRELAALQKDQGTLKSPEAQKVISDGIDGFKGGDGGKGLIDLPVTLRVQTAKMFLAQGAQYNEATKSYEPRDLRGKDDLDQLYQPTRAAQLLKEADDKNRQTWGSNATDSDLAQLKAVGYRLAPAQFKAEVDKVNTKSWSTGADLLAGTGAFAAEVLGPVAISALSGGRIKPGMLESHAIGTGAALVTATALRAGTMYLGDGGESLSTSLIHGAGVTAFVSGAKYSAMGIDKYLARGAQNFDEVVAVRRFANAAGGDVTMGQLGDRYLQQGFIKEGQAMKASAFADRALKDVSDDEIKSLNLGLKGNRAVEAIVKVEGQLTPQFKAVQALEARDIKTVGDLRSTVGKQLNEYGEIVTEAKAAGLSPKLTMRETMEALGKAGNDKFNTAEKISKALAALEDGAINAKSSLPITPRVPLPEVKTPKMGIIPSKQVMGPVESMRVNIPLTGGKVKTLGDLDKYVSNATADGEVARLYPATAGQPADAMLRDVEAAAPNMLGKPTSASWRQVERIAPEVRDVLPPARGVVGRVADKAGDILYRDRFYRFAGLGKGDPVLADSEKLAHALNSRQDLTMVGSYLTGRLAYDNITGIGDNLGTTIKDADGTERKATLGDAVKIANFGTTNPGVMDVVAQKAVIEAVFAGAVASSLYKPVLSNWAPGTVRSVLSKPTFMAVVPYVGFSNVGAITAPGKVTPFLTEADQPMTDYDYSAGLGSQVPQGADRAQTKAPDKAPDAVPDADPKPAADAAKPAVDAAPKPAADDAKPAADVAKPAADAAKPAAVPPKPAAKSPADNIQPPDASDFPGDQP